MEIRRNFEVPEHGNGDFRNQDRRFLHVSKELKLRQKLLRQTRNLIKTIGLELDIYFSKINTRRHMLIQDMSQELS